MSLYFSLKICTFFTLIQVVLSNYCEWGLCKYDQYCCGNNLCCEYVYSLWYFWIGMIFLVILLTACGGLIRLHCRSNSFNNRGQSFTALPTDISDEDPLFRVSGDEPLKHQSAFP